MSPRDREKFLALRFIFPKLQMQLALDVHEDIIRLIASRAELEPATEARTRGEDTTDSWTRVRLDYIRRTVRNHGG